VRLGFADNFRLNKNTISPAFKIDIPDGEQIYVFGVKVGWGF